MLPDKCTLIKNTLELTLIPGMGIRTQNKLLEEIPDRGNLFTMGERFYKSLGVSAEALRSILKRAYQQSAEEILCWTAKENCRILVRGTDGYPSALEELVDAPLVLYAQGNLVCLSLPGIAIVGSRRPTLYGVQIAQGLANDLSFRGICIVSGLARGVDAAAHRGAIETGGHTVAVLGCGIDIVYPPEHRQLKEQILCDGLVLSEFPPGTAS